MPKLSRRRRMSLPGSAFACPSARKYPLTDRAHVRNAISRYSQAKTSKCAGGGARICQAAERFGIKPKAALCKIFNNPRIYVTGDA